MAARRWYCRAVNAAGTSTGGELTRLNVLQVEDALNAPGGFTVECDASDTSVLNIVNPALSTLREVQVWCEDVNSTDYLVAWGRVVRVDVMHARIRIECAGLLSYFARRHVGQAQRTNMLTNGGFETVGLASWTATSSVTATRDSTRKIAGTYAAQLVQADVAADRYISQDFTSPSYSVGIEWTATAWVYVATAGWTGPAYGRRGLFLQQGTGIATRFSSAEINRETPRGQWVKLETTLWIPPGTTTTVQVRCYAPAGTVWWDEVRVVAQESWASIDDDVTDVLHGLASHAQDTAIGKSALSIGNAGAATTRTITRVWPYAEHANILSAMREIVDADGTADIGVVCTSTTRTFTVWPSGRTGTAPVVDSSTLVALDLSVDLERGANSVVVLGPGSGVTREEAGARDTGVFGGVTLEAVQAAPADATVDSLTGRAAAALDALKTPVSLTATVGGDDWVSGIVRGTVTVGMTTEVTVTQTAWDIDEVNYRIVAWRLDPVRQLVTLDLAVA